MTIFDLALLLILIGFTINGLFKGLIKMIGAIAALVLAILVASRLHVPFYEWGSNYISGSESVLKVVAFIIILLFVSKLVEYIFSLVEKLYKFASIIPGTRLINNLLGAIFGLLLGVLLLGVIVYVMLSYLDIAGAISGLIVNSNIALMLLETNKMMLPLFPEAFKLISDLF